MIDVSTWKYVPAKSKNKEQEDAGDWLSEDLEKKGKTEENSNYVWSIQFLENVRTTTTSENTLQKLVCLVSLLKVHLSK